MNYELAKELVDAGFGLPRTGGWFTGQNGESECAPSLEELIEACGDEFIELEKIRNDWWCKGMWEKCGEGECPKYDIKGSSPVEAVARLWLALKSNPIHEVRTSN